MDWYVAAAAKDNRVVLDEEKGSYLENQATGKKAPARKEKGVYVLDGWIGVPGCKRESILNRQVSFLPGLIHQ